MVEKPTHPIVEPPKPGRPDVDPPKPEKPVDPDFGKPKPPDRPTHLPAEDDPRLKDALEAAKREELKKQVVQARTENPKRDPVNVEKVILLDKMNAALVEYDGESNIPLDHEYWACVNRYRGLM